MKAVYRAMVRRDDGSWSLLPIQPTLTLARSDARDMSEGGKTAFIMREDAEGCFIVGGYSNAQSLPNDLAAFYVARSGEVAKKYGVR